MAVVGEAVVELKADGSGFTSSASRELNKSKASFERSGAAAGDGFSRGFSKEAGGKLLSSAKGLAAKIAVTIGGAYAIRSGINVVQNALAAADESRKIGAQTDAVIKSTGASANVTADAIGKMATAMSLKTGIDDEAIQQGQNLLLTFTNIRNEAGKGNDVFDQSTKTLLDLATAMGTEPKAAAIQLGKALNDPSKGITALTKVGVTFTQQQKDQIKALQASGDMMGAQKIILAELNKEFGGSAEAQASAMDKIRVAAGNLQETFGAAILPAVQQLLPVITSVFDQLAPVLETLGSTLGSVIAAVAPTIATLGAVAGPIIEQIGAALVSLAPAVQPLVSALGAIVSAFAPLLPVVAEVFGMIAEAITPVIKTLGGVLKPIVESLAGVFASVFEAVGPVLGDLASSLVGYLNELGPVIGQLVESFAPLVPVIAEVAGTLGGALGEVLTAIAPLIADLASTLGGVLAETLAALQPAFLAIGDAIAAAAPSLGELGAALVEIIKALSPVLPLIGTLVSSLVGALAPVLPVIADALVSVAEAIAPLIPVVVQIVEALGAGLSDVIAALAPALGEIVGALGELLVALLPILTPLLDLTVLLIEKIGVPVLVKIAEAIALVASALASIISWVAGLVEALVQLDWSSLASKAGVVVSAVLGFFQRLPGQILGFVVSIPGRVASLLGRIIEFVTGLPAKLAVAAAGMFVGLLDEAKAVPGKIAEFLGELPKRITGLAKLVLKAAIELGGKILSGLGKGLSKATEFVGDIAKSVKDALIGLINDLVGLLNDAIPNKLGWGSLSIDIPNEPIPTIKLAQGAIVPPRRGGVLANIAEAGWPEVVMSTNPAMRDRNRMMLRQSGLASQLADTPTVVGGDTYRVEKVEVVTPRDGRAHAVEFLEGLREELWLQGANV